MGKSYYKTMKRVLIILSAIIFSVSLCIAQSNIQEELERKKQQEKAQREAAERQRQATERQRQEAERQKETNYNHAIESAEKNFSHKKYAQAKQDYQTAVGIKPENAATINPKIEELDNLILEERYQQTIASAESNFNRKQYAQAKQDYRTALGMKPENASLINPKIDEIDKKMSEPALLYIYRPRPRGSIGSTRYEVLLDNVLVGNTTNNWKTIVTMDTFGRKTVSATIKGRRAEVKLDVVPGESYYILCEIKSRTVKTGKYRDVKQKDGTTKKVEITETEYTPVLKLVAKNVGEPAFEAIKVK